MEPEILKILNVGCRAASPYNLQFWRFREKDGKLLVFMETGQGGLLEYRPIYFYTAGCLLHNLGEGARHYGYSISYGIVSTRLGLGEPLLEIEFKKNPQPQAEYDIRHVISRATNRSKYFSKPAAGAVFERVKEIFNSSSAQVIDISGNQEFMHSYARTEMVRASYYETAQEMTRCIRINPVEAEREKDLLDVRTLGLDKPAELALRLMRYQPLHRVFSALGMAHLSERYEYELLRNSPLILAFADTDQSPPNLIAAWMRIQEVINCFEKLGLSSQLIASGIDLVKLNPANLTADARRILERERDTISSCLATDAGLVLTVLRAGYAHPPAVRALRKDAAELFLK